MVYGKQYVLYIDMVGTAVCETAVQLSVRTVYRYGVYCCVCHGEKMAISCLKISVFLVHFI
jgi:hypothetical protein